jgi:hypothetical protein
LNDRVVLVLMEWEVKFLSWSRLVFKVTEVKYELVMVGHEYWSIGQLISSLNHQFSVRTNHLGVKPIHFEAGSSILTLDYQFYAG